MIRQIHAPNYAPANIAHGQRLQQRQGPELRFGLVLVIRHARHGAAMHQRGHDFGLAFAGENQSRKNYFRALIIWTLFWLALWAVLTALGFAELIAPWVVKKIEIWRKSLGY